MDVRIIVLVVSAGIVLYAYFLYPLLLLVMRTVTRGARAPRGERPLRPAVSITLPAYNAEATIRPVLDALVAVDYPRALRQILVVSDGSTDRTDDIVREYAPQGVELLRVEGRLGKTEVENRALPHLRHSIVVNTDASVILRRDAVRRLVEAMRDPSVGVASSRDVSVASAGAARESSEAVYVGYEMWVRGLETDTGGIVGASGSLYAIRASLHQRVMPSHLSRDFSAALWAKMHGLKAVSVPEAVCYVPRADGMHVEWRRKVRTMSRGLQTLAFHRQLLNPFRHGVFAWKLLSHKLIRWLVPFALVAGAGAVSALGGGPLVLAGLALAAIGWWWPRDREVPRLSASAAYLTSGVVAGIIAWKRALLDSGAAVWEPTPRAVSPTAAPAASATPHRDRAAPTANAWGASRGARPDRARR
jgi:cellulose synthase/poly-beta-1,6-N-acetylglucosamine synthase-like glycosyltransferase